MLNFSTKFSSDLKSGTVINSLVAIYPKCDINNLEEFETFLQTGSGADEILSIYGSIDNYFKEACIFASTTSTFRKASSDDFSGHQFHPIIITEPRFKEGIDINERVAKVPNISLTLATNLDGQDFGEKLSLCNNALIKIYWYTEGSTYAEKIFTGSVTDISESENKVTLKCAHLCDLLYEIQVPINNIQNSATIPERYRGAPIPFVYGEVDGAYTSIIRKDFENSGGSEDVLAFDSKPCGGFIDSEMADGVATEAHSETNILYKPNNAQIYISDGDYYLTILKNSPFWLGGDPDSFDRGDKANMHNYYYLGFDQYKIDGTDTNNNQAILINHIETPYVRNTVSNNLAYVQVRDYFDSIESAPDEPIIENGRDASVSWEAAMEPDNDSLYIGAGNEGVWYMINNIDAQSFSDSLESFSNRTKTMSYDSLDLRWWNVCSGKTFNGFNRKIIKNCSVKFKSGVTSGVGGRHFTASYYSMDIRSALFHRENAENLRHHLNDGLDVDATPWPAEAGCTAFRLYNGNFKTLGGADIGDSPDIHPNLDSEEVPKVAATPIFPYYQIWDADDATMQAATVPVDDGEGNTKFSSHFFNQDVLESGCNSWISGSIQYSDYNFPLANLISFNSEDSDWSHWENYPNFPGTHNTGDFNWANWTTAEQEGPSQIDHDGYKWAPKSWAYADSTDTTMVWVPPMINQKVSKTDGDDDEIADLRMISYNEALVRDFYVDRILLIDELKEKDFFAKVQGRKVYTSTNSNTLSQGDNTPTEILYHFIREELSLGKFGDSDSFNAAKSEHQSLKAGISVGEKIDSKEFIDVVVANSKLILKTNADGTFDISSLKSYYENDDVNITIKADEVLSYKSSKTPLKEIYNEVLVEFDLKYAGNSYGKNTGLITGQENEDLSLKSDSFPIDLERKLERQDYFYDNYQGLVVGMDMMTEKMYANLGIDDFQYTRDYYNMPEDTNSLTFKSDTIRDFESAYEMQKFLMLWYCNQHLILDVNLPLSYVGIEVGDIIAFDKLMNGKKLNGFDYSKSYVKNGQVIYPYFIVTNTDKSLQGINIKCIQIHKLSWGIDGTSSQSYGLGWPDDNQTYNHAGEQITEGFERVVDPVIRWKNSDNQLPSFAYTETIEIQITGVFDKVDEDSITFTSVGDTDWYADEWVFISYVDSNEGSGQHRIGIQSKIQNITEDLLRTAKIEAGFKRTDWVIDDETSSGLNEFNQTWEILDDDGEEDEDDDNGELPIPQITMFATEWEPEWFFHDNSDRFWAEDMEEHIADGDPPGEGPYEGHTFRVIVVCDIPFNLRNMNNDHSSMGFQLYVGTSSESGNATPMPLFNIEAGGHLEHHSTLWNTEGNDGATWTDFENGISGYWRGYELFHYQQPEWADPERYATVAIQPMFSDAYAEDWNIEAVEFEYFDFVISQEAAPPQPPITADGDASGTGLPLSIEDVEAATYYVFYNMFHDYGMLPDDEWETYKAEGWTLWEDQEDFWAHTNVNEDAYIDLSDVSIITDWVEGGGGGDDDDDFHGDPDDDDTEGDEGGPG